MASANAFSLHVAELPVSPEYPFAAVRPLVPAVALLPGLQFLVVPLPARVFCVSRHQGAAKAPRQHGGMYCSHGKYPFMN
jgi:hypothetical protein